jgi:hypothetical protein
VKIVIDTIKGHPFWALAHIGEEIFKLMPTRAHLNTATTVSAKGS